VPVPDGLTAPVLRDRAGHARRAAQLPQGLEERPIRGVLPGLRWREARRAAFVMEPEGLQDEVLPVLLDAPLRGAHAGVEAEAPAGPGHDLVEGLLARLVPMLCVHDLPVAEVDAAAALAVLDSHAATEAVVHGELDDVRERAAAHHAHEPGCLVDEGARCVGHGHDLSGASRWWRRPWNLEALRFPPHVERAQDAARRRARGPALHRRRPNPAPEGRCHAMDAHATERPAAASRDGAARVERAASPGDRAERRRRPSAPGASSPPCLLVVRRVAPVIGGPARARAPASG
jgi:hypothetical protein